MRALNVILLLFFYLPLFCQKQGNKYFLKKVGWTFVLPSDFIVVDNKKAAERSLSGMESNPSDLRISISAGKSSGEMFQASLVRDRAGGSTFKRVIQTVKNLDYLTFVKTIPGAKLDSSSSVRNIDGIVFDKYCIKIMINGSVIYFFLLSRYYKGNNFEINYVYATDLSKQEIETMLNESKFSK
jgi:hypothetical protein